jgi:hypothetical protein
VEGYLGEFPVENDRTVEENVMWFITSYGQIEGDHHRAWVIDQVARIVLGTPVIAVEARWDNGQRETRISTGEPSDRYLEWVEEMLGDWDPECECHEYEYDEGIPP